MMPVQADRCDGQAGPGLGEVGRTTDVAHATRRAALASAALLLGSGCAGGRVSSAEVVVDAGTRHQTMHGWSTQERLWDDPHLTETYRPPRPGEEPFGRSAVDIPAAAREEMLRRMYRELGLTQVHVVMDKGGQPQRDGPQDLRWKNSDGHTDWVRAAQPHGLRSWGLFFHQTEDWMSRTDPTDLFEWEMVRLRRWKALGAEPHLVFPFNEPSYNQRRWVASPDYVRELVRKLGRAFAREGFRTAIVAPEDLNPQLGLRQLEVLMADEEVRGYVAVISTHLYGGVNAEGARALARMRDRYARPLGKPLWMTEFFRGSGGLGGSALAYAALMHDLIATYDVSHVNYEWAYFGQWADARTHFFHITHDRGNTYTGYTVDKAYYAFGQFSRFVPPGAVRIAAESSVPGLKVTAFDLGDAEDDGGIAVVAINNTGRDVAARVEVAGAPVEAVLAAARTSAREDGAPVARPAVSAGRLSTTFPASSATTLVVGAAPAGAQAAPRAPRLDLARP